MPIKPIQPGIYLYLVRQNHMMKYFLFLILLFANIVAAAQHKIPYQKLKVMTYNIHHANPPSKPGLIDIDAIVSVIRKEQPDLVALQEVDVNTGRSGRLNQAEEIARKLGMQFFFGKAIDHDGGEYGVAILSRHPISDPVVYRLPTDSASNGERRVLATAKITLQGGKVILFGNTHLDAEEDPLNREMQISEINRIALKEPLPFILAGDLNAAPGSEVIRMLDRQFVRTCNPCKPTFPITEPQIAIDFIAVNSETSFNIILHKVLTEQYASDHLPVVAILELKK